MIIELEVIPDVLKRGIIVPVYKGGGRDPLKTDSYRGITLTSMISKLLESLVLERLESVFASAGIPHVNQSAYTEELCPVLMRFCHTGGCGQISQRREPGVHVPIRPAEGI